MRTILLVGALLVAGCSGAPAADPAGTTGPDATSPVDAANFTAEAPVWRVGQSWEHNWSFRDQTIGTFDVRTVVARDDGDSWLLGVPDATTAAFHAAFYFPDLGNFRKSDLTNRADDGAFEYPWYSFPLSDGKSWTATEKNIDFNAALPDEKTVSFVAHLAPKADGSPRFHIIATLDGNLRAMYDYDPAYQWFSEYAYYNATAAADPDDPDFTIESSVPTYGFSGPVYASTGDMLLQHASQFGVLADPDPSHIQPLGSFTPAAEHDHLLVLAFNFAVCGAQTTHLIPPGPSGTTFAEYPYLDVDGPACANMGGGTASGGELYIPSIAGEWRVVTVGAAVIISGGGILAYGITEVVIDVVPAAPPAPSPSASLTPS